MTIRVDKKMREKIDIKKINVKENRYIYSADGKNVFRTLIDDKYCDVSGIKLDKPKEIDYISICKRLEVIEDKLDELIKRYDSN
tara:strand:- start:39 stop:290 length:252 start_codon:yes stop_codon:yes gene_type:complete